MVKRISLFFLGTLFLLLVLNGCTPVYCSTPNILSDGKCCLDKDKDGKCDEGEIIIEEIYVPEQRTTTNQQEEEIKEQQPKNKRRSVKKSKSK